MVLYRGEWLVRTKYAFTFRAISHHHSCESRQRSFALRLCTLTIVSIYLRFCADSNLGMQTSFSLSNPPTSHGLYKCLPSKCRHRPPQAIHLLLVTEGKQSYVQATLAASGEATGAAGRKSARCLERPLRVGLGANTVTYVPLRLPSLWSYPIRVQSRTSKREVGERTMPDSGMLILRKVRRPPLFGWTRKADGVVSK